MADQEQNSEVIFDHENKSLNFACNISDERMQEIEDRLNEIHDEECENAKKEDRPHAASRIVEKFSQEFNTVELAIMLFSVTQQLNEIEMKNEFRKMLGSMLFSDAHR